MNQSLHNQIKLVSISEAAKYLGVSIDTLRRWDRLGVLKSNRLDGKNRYFALDDLDQLKNSKPLLISEVSSKLKISPTTLRRLEAKGLIQSGRNKAGKRTYDQKVLESFLKTGYYLRKSQVKKTPSKPVYKVVEPKKIFSEPTQRWEIRSYLPNYVTISIFSFVLLITVGAGNVILAQTAKTQLPPSPNVLSVTKDIQPITETQPKAEPTPAPQIKYIKIIEDAEVNLREEPSTSSKKLGKAKSGEIFEVVGQVPGWFEIKTQTGSNAYVADTYVVSLEDNE